MNKVLRKIFIKSFIISMYVCFPFFSLAQVDSNPKTFFSQSTQSTFENDSARNSTLASKLSQQGGIVVPTLNEKIEARNIIADIVKQGKTSLEGGTWTGGGGEGIICFQTEKDKEQAFDSQGRIKIQSRAKITRLESFDLVENQSEFLAFSAQPGITYDVFLDFIIENNIEPYSPYFATRLRQAISMIVNADGSLKWNDQGSLIRLNDAGKKRVVRFVDPTCAYVQLAIRYSKKTKGPMPAVFVDYDKGLFELMGKPKEWGAVNQAALILHESLYLAGYDLGLRDSSDIRVLVSFFMFRNIEGYLASLQAPSLEAAFTTMLYSFGMKDSTNLYLQKESGRHAYTKSSRQWSRAQLAQNYQKNWSQLIATDNEVAICNQRKTLSRQCEDRLLSRLGKKLSLEEAFLFAVATTHNGGLHPYNSDVFVTPGVADETPGKEFCQTLQLYSEELNKFAPSMVEIFKKARDYCKGWGKI